MSNDRLREFWTKTLQNFTNSTSIPIDDRSSQTGSFSISESAIGGMFTDDQGEYAPEDVLLAAWSILLARYCRETDVLFGVLPCSSAQEKDEVRTDEPIPFPVLVDEHRSIGDFLKGLTEQRDEFRSVSPCPLSDIQRWSGFADSQPLFDSAVVEAETDNLIELVTRKRGWQSIPLVVAVTCEPSPRLIIRYDSGRFSSELIDRLLGHLASLMTSMLRDKHQPILDLNLLTGPERQQLLIDWNDTATLFPDDKCLHELFVLQAQQQPEAVAVTSGSAQLTYRELDRKSNQLASYLRSRGVKTGSQVGICAQRSVDAVVGLLGIAKSGAAYVPLDPQYPKDRLQFMIADADVTVLLTQNRILDRLPPHSAAVICLDSDWDQISRSSSEPVPNPAEPTDLAYVIFTSGSTGRPKAVMLDHRGRVNNFTDFNRRFSVGPGDRLLALSSLSFDMSAYDTFGILASGATIVLPEDSSTPDPARWAALMVSQQVTVWHSVPALLEMLLDYISNDPELTPRFLRLALLGGDWIPLSLPDRLRERVRDVQIISMGGATEVSMDSTIFEIEAVDPLWKSIPYGKPMANQLAYVLDDQLRLLPIGVAGELHLGGIGVGHGYLKRPELTQDKFIANPFRSGERLYKTGDLARFREDGNLELLGRIDHQMKVRGFRIEPGEIESVLRTHPAVHECLVKTHSAPGGDKRLVAYVVQGKDNTRSGPDWQQAQTGQVGQWEEVYNAAYQRTAESDDPTFNIVSWDSSYTGQPIPAEQMREWVDSTVGRILALRPRRVLEIGCGTGLLLFRVAPHCEQYLGTDISAVALDHVREQLSHMDLPQVSLRKQPAHDFKDIEAGVYDTIVLNSIALDFPDVDYLYQVLQEASRMLSPGGTIFVGDNRNLLLTRAFQASVQLYKSDRSVPTDQLREDIERKIRIEEELLLDPDFFRVMPQLIPEIACATVQLKRGVQSNEMRDYRYDVTLHQSAAVVAADVELEWRTGQVDPHKMEDLIRDKEPRCLLVRGVPNARLQADVLLASHLLEKDCPNTAGELREWQRRFREEFSGSDPEEWYRLGEQVGYQVIVDYAADGRPDCFDVTLAKPDSENPAQVASTRVVPLRPLPAFANNPLLAQISRQLVPELRAYLGERLPSYMVPSRFVLLEAFPLTPNGKIDRRALPNPDSSRPPSSNRDYQPAVNDLELSVAIVWSEALGVDCVDRRDSFIELGGSSLLATQVAAQLSGIFELPISLTDVYTMTLSELASHLLKKAATTGVDACEIGQSFVQFSQQIDETNEDVSDRFSSVM